MTPTLEILVPAGAQAGRLNQTVASLVAQTDRRFSVLLGENAGRAGLEEAADAEKQLAAVGIMVRRLARSNDSTRIEHWNGLHAHARADWLKPLVCGDTVKPGYIAALLRRLEERPAARLVRCDVEVLTQWGLETVRAPFDEPSVSPAEFADYFPARVDWICRSANVAYSRTSWSMTGGYCNQLPGFTSLNLNVTLALHHGLENLAAPLASVESRDLLPWNECEGDRVNFAAELWLILRQARNYCLAANVPWRGGVWSRAAAAWLGRW